MKIVLIDTFALIHRAYHALPEFRTKTGEPSGAVYGFCSMFLKLVQELQPEGAIAAFDSPEITFRRQLFPAYQAQRPEKKPDFKTQVERVKEFLSLLRVPIISQPGYEGDDIIGSLVRSLTDNQNNQITILTGDNDTLQLVRPGVRVLSLKKGITETVSYDEAGVRNRFGFSPELIPDFKALAGDSSDNIPGVPGIGVKTATKLIQQFGNIEALIEAARQKQLNSALAEKLLAQTEALRLAKTLATIRTDLELKPGEFTFQPQLIYSEPVLSFFKKMGFVSLIKRLKPESVEPEFQPERLNLSLTKTNLGPVKEELRKQKRIFVIFKDNFESIISGGESFCFVDNDSLVELLLDKELEKVVFDLKTGLGQWGDDRLIKELAEEKVWDLKIISWLIDPEFKNYQLERLVRRFLGLSWPAEIRSAEKAIVELEGLVRLFDRLIEILRREELAKLYLEVEFPLILVLLKMERRGILVDRLALEKAEKVFQAKLIEREKQIFQLAGRNFNLNSPKELSGVLYGELKLPVSKVKKLKSGYYSTDSEALERLKTQHQIIPLILDWRELAKLQNTYLKTLPKFISREDQRVHTIFSQVGTATGRLASELPNLQNIPKHVELAQEIRKLFISAKGFSLVSFDYSQIELRLAANLSGDETLKKAFLSGQDIHQLTASLVWQIPLDKVTPQERFRAKALNFGIIYGMGVRTLSRATGLTQDQAKKFIKDYFKTFPGLRKYIDETLSFLRANGYTQTQFGRKRYFPEYFSGKARLVSQAERMALNLTFQGLAADIIKKAMIQIDQELIKESLENEVRLILQIHDELLFEIKDEIIEKISPRIKKIMEEVYPAEVPLKVIMAQGKNWAEIS